MAREPADAIDHSMTAVVLQAEGAQRCGPPTRQSRRGLDAVGVVARDALSQLREQLVDQTSRRRDDLATA